MSPRIFPQRSAYLFEILERILHFSSFQDLVKWMHLPPPAPKIVLQEIKRRVFDLLARHIPRSQCADFMDLVEECDGALVGELPLCLLTGCSASSATAPLVIVVAKDMDAPITSFLGQYGYLVASKGSNDSKKGPVRTVTRLHERTNGGTKVSQWTRCVTPLPNTFQHITVVVSRDQPLDVILAAPTTAGMNAISSTHIISFYPDLTASKAALAVEGVEDTTLLDIYRLPPSFTTSTSNAHWKKPCGHVCPAIWRKSKDDAGVARYRWSHRPVVSFRLADWLPREGKWSDILSPHPQDMTFTRTLKWRIMSRCWNPRCEHTLKYEARSKYVVV